MLAITEAAAAAIAEILAWTGQCAKSATHWQAERAEFQARMSRAGAHIRSREEIKLAVDDAKEQWQRLQQTACACAPDELGEALRTRQLCFVHLVYLEAIQFGMESGIGSRGSAIVLDPAGVKIHDRLDERWCIARTLAISKVEC